MKVLLLEIITNTASFRNPDFQNFHKTLPLPPPTSLIGFAGAAMGLSPKSAQDFFDENHFFFGVYGESLGKAKDTWKYTNKTNGPELYNYHPDFFGSVIARELLFTNKFVIAFSSNNILALQKLNDAFFNPRFALTMGNSDSLAFIKRIQNTNKISKQNKFRNCIIEGNVIDKVLNNPDKTLEFSIYQNAEPVTYDLPVRFCYKEDYGNRTISNVCTFSFISKEMFLNYEIDCVIYKDVAIPICRL